MDTVDWDYMEIHIGTYWENIYYPNKKLLILCWDYVGSETGLLGQYFFQDVLKIFVFLNVQV